MKTRVLLLVIAVFVAGNSFAQKNRKAKKAAKKELSVANEKDLVGDILASKEFEFVAHVVYPLGKPSRNLGGENYNVIFTEDQIDSTLPYYGTVKGGSFGAAAGKGMNFKGKPTKYRVKETKKGYTVSADVYGSSDDYSLILKVEKSGRAKLTVSSRYRQSHTYQGEIVKSQL